MRLTKLIAIVAIAFLAGCASQPRQNYADAVLSRPMPSDDNQRMQECGWVRSEIARQEGLAAYGATIATSPMMAMAYRAVAQQNIAALETRAANIRCNAAFSNSPVAPAQATPARPSFDECFSKCQKYTDRTKDQCFDSCNK